MPRGVYLLGVGLVLVALALAFTDWALSLRPGVTEANVKRIKPGMTLAEVEAVLGAPGLPAGISGGFYSWRVLYEWAAGGDVAVVCLEFHGDSPGSVLDATFHRGAGQGPLARLRAWLGW